MQFVPVLFTRVAISNVALFPVARVTKYPDPPEVHWAGDSFTGGLPGLESVTWAVRLVGPTDSTAASSALAVVTSLDAPAIPLEVEKSAAAGRLPKSLL